MVTPMHVFYDNTGRRYVAHVPEMYFAVAMWREKPWRSRQTPAVA